MKRDLIIIGAGGVGGHIATNLKDYSSEYNLLGFLDDNAWKNKTEFVGFPILGNVNSISNYPPSIAILVGIAFPFLKYKVVEKLKVLGYTNFPSFIAKSSWLSTNITLGEGCILYPGSRVNYNCSIGNFVVLNMACALGHDCMIADYVSFAPGVLLGGKTTIGRLTQMGIGSTTIQGITIGENTVVGAATVIIKDVKNNAVIVGNPGRILKHNS